MCGMYSALVFAHSVKQMQDSAMHCHLQEMDQ